MKWTNSNNTKSIDLTKIVGYEYTSENMSEKVIVNESRIVLFLNGYTLNYHGHEAEEIYKMLTSIKEVI